MDIKGYAIPLTPYGVSVLTGSVSAKPRKRPRKAVSVPCGESHPAWANRAPELADAAMRLVARHDCCGGYRGPTPTTRKQGDFDWLPIRDGLQAHFSGHRTLGLHSTTRNNHCYWLAFDLDAHNGESADANLEAAELIAARLRANHLTPYIFDSDGRGGLHVWAVFQTARQAAGVYELAQQVADGLDVETFPKQPRIRPGGFGNWIRLPGRHHKRDHWSRVWTGDGWGTPDETIDAILEMCQP